MCYNMCYELMLSCPLTNQAWSTVSSMPLALRKKTLFLSLALLHLAHYSIKVPHDRNITYKLDKQSSHILLLKVYIHVLCNDYVFKNWTVRPTTLVFIFCKDRFMPVVYNQPVYNTSHSTKMPIYQFVLFEIILHTLLQFSKWFCRKAF